MPPGRGSRSSAVDDMEPWQRLLVHDFDEDVVILVLGCFSDEKVARLGCEAVLSHQARNGGAMPDVSEIKGFVVHMMNERISRMRVDMEKGKDVTVGLEAIRLDVEALSRT